MADDYLAHEQHMNNWWSLAVVQSKKLAGN